MAGKFHIHKDAKGEFRWRLKGRNGEIVAQSESYQTKALAKRGAEDAQRAADKAEIVDDDD